MVKVERGAETVQWGKLFPILEGLGIRIAFDLPDASPEQVAKEAMKASRRADARRDRHAALVANANVSQAMPTFADASRPDAND